MRKIILIAGAAFAVTACAHKPVGMKVEYQVVSREVKRPCPVQQPQRPAPLARPLPFDDPSALIDRLTAKLIEWAGPGKYGDQAQEAIATCIAP